MSEKGTSLPDVFDFSRKVTASLGCPKDREPYKQFLKIHKNPLRVTKCPFCASPIHHWMTQFKDDLRSFPYRDWDTDINDYHLILCGTCGWWRYLFVNMSDPGYPITIHNVSILTRHSIAADSAPLAEIKRILCNNWKYSKEISAKKAEDLVASVFADHLNCELHYISNGVYAKDGGVDFVLVNAENGLEFAFQVKRRIHSKAERVQPIREFLGAISMSPYRKAYYVTTANRFTSAALSEIDLGRRQLESRNISLELVSGRMLHELLLQQKTKPATASKLLHNFGNEGEWFHIQDQNILSKMWMHANFPARLRKLPAYDFPSVLQVTFAGAAGLGSVEQQKR